MKPTQTFDYEILLRTKLLGAILGWMTARFGHSGFGEPESMAAGVILAGIYDYLAYQIKRGIQARRMAG